MGVRHEVLNAKNHEREASIVAQAGRKGAVTVSTNMAGRGTDILLGGNAEFMTKDACLKEKVAERLAENEAQYVADEHFYYFTHHDQFYRVRARQVGRDLRGLQGARPTRSTTKWSALGGLHIVATERHESRRIDNQLRGRAGRQGDPGSSRFFLSLQDDLLRIFGGERMQNLMLRLGMEEDVPIEIASSSPSASPRPRKPSKCRISKSRKHLLEYDDVNNKQRQAVYGMRRQLLEGIDQKERVMDMVRGIVDQYIDMRCPDDKHPDTWDLATLRNDVLTQFGVKIDLAELANLTRTELCGRHLRSAAAEISGEGRPGGRRRHAPDRAHRHAAGHRQPVEGPPAVDGRAEAGHRQPRLRPEGPAGGVQEGVLRAVHRHDGPHRRRDGPLPVLPAGAAPDPARCCRSPTKTRRRKTTEDRSGAPGCRASSSARPPRARWRTSRATSSARRKRNWRTCNSWAATVPPGRRQVAARPEGGPQRSLPLRQRQEIQEVPRDRVGKNLALMAG